MNANPLTQSLSKTEFVERVLGLRPQLAVFDCDGTLWSGDAGEGFFRWETERGLIAAELAREALARYEEYRIGKVSEEDMCGEMVTLHRGLSEAEVTRATAGYFEAEMVPRIFLEMQELVRTLRQDRCDVWAVSSTNEWLIRDGMKHFDIAEEHVLAAAVEVENGIVTDRLIRVPSGEGKSRAIREVIGRDPDVAFGNSRWDVDMLKIARHRFAVNPNPDLEEMARDSRWGIYWPESVRS
jgi:phosphoserine phosphatase